MDHPGLGARHLVDQAGDVRLMLTVEAQLPVGIVLDDHEAVLDGKRQQLQAPRARHGRAARIGEGGHDVQQLRARRRRVAQQRLELVDVQTVRIDPDGQRPYAGDLQHAQRAGVGRALDDRGVAGGEQRAHQQVEALLRAAGHQHVIGRAARAARGEQRRHRLAHAGQAVGRAVLQAGDRHVAQRRVGGLAHAVAVEQLGAGVAAGERHHPGHRHQLRELAHERLADVQVGGGDEGGGVAHRRTGIGAGQGWPMIAPVVHHAGTDGDAGTEQAYSEHRRRRIRTRSRFIHGFPVRAGRGRRPPRSAARCPPSRARSAGRPRSPSPRSAPTAARCSARARSSTCHPSACCG